MHRPSVNRKPSGGLSREQVTGSVRWTESVSYLLDHLDCTQFIELGPGGVLAGLVGRIRKGTPVISISNVASLTDALESAFVESTPHFDSRRLQRPVAQLAGCDLKPINLSVKLEHDSCRHGHR